jgi:hypothetical protein
MHLRVVLSSFVLLGWAGIALAVPAITVGDSHPLPNTSANQTNTIDIFYDSVSGGGPMQGQTIYISVADENDGGLGTVTAGEPFISAVDALTGTVWASNNAGNPAPAPVTDNQVWSYALTTGTGTNDATGKLLTVTINRNGAPAGSTWGLRVFIGVPGLGGPYSSAWDNQAQLGVAFTTQDNASGWNGVTGVPDGAFSYLIPEPSSIVLGLFAAAGLGAVVIRRRRAAA